ncbi:hypothetical protein IWX81_000468 [Salinibacterium sp. CAN_S4]
MVLRGKRAPSGRLLPRLTESDRHHMLRLLRFLPVMLPIVAKAVKSPQGQKVIADARRRISAKRNGSTTRPTR